MPTSFILVSPLIICMVMSFFAIMLVSAHLFYSFLMQTLYLLQPFIQYTCCPTNAVKVYLPPRNVRNYNYLACAQCSPRPACPLKGALLMQVQDQLQGAPVLVLAGDPVSLKRMQNHAPYACMAFIRKNGGIFGDF